MEMKTDIRAREEEPAAPPEQPPAADDERDDEREDEVRGPLHWLAALRPKSLLTRVILINLTGLFVLVSGILYFNQLRENLIDSRVDSLMTQARIMAAAVASAASVDTGDIIVDPDRLVEGGDKRPRAIADPSRLDFLIRPEQAGPVLRRLVVSTGTIARIYDREGVLSVDTRHLYGFGGILRLDLPPVEPPRRNPFDRLWQWLNKKLFGHDYPRQKEYGLENGKSFPEVNAALNGASVSVVRLNDKGEIVVTVATPIQRYKAVLGALLLSTRGGEIDAVLQKERRVVVMMFVIAGIVTLLLSVFLASQIAEPIRRLARTAEKVRRGIDNRVEIPDFTHRRDEIGHLSGALRDMTRALYDRINAIEAFAADVAHELKNPLTSLRSAVETLRLARTAAQRQRLVEIITDDVKRLDRLISDISDASRLDAELARAHAEEVNVAELLRTLVALANETARPGDAPIGLDIAPPPSGMNEAQAYAVLGHDTRLAQVVQNLLANARSFSPEGGKVRVQLRRTRRAVQFTVEDDGPGIREDNRERIFQRFYTDRPEQYFGKNSGLGLAISRQIVEAHKGRIWAENRRSPGGDEVLGARFIVRLPAQHRK